MKRIPLKRLLLAYKPHYNEEKLTKNKMLEFLDLYENCFERECVPGHFTASAWLLSHDLKYVLLTHHAKLDKWLQLGGHCDGDPNLLEVALKEAKEESGLSHIEVLSSDIFDIDVHLIPAYKQELAHLHYDVRFLLRASNTTLFVKNSESKELRWCSNDLNLFPTRDASILRMLKKWQMLLPELSVF